MDLGDVGRFKAENVTLAFMNRFGLYILQNAHNEI